MVSRQGGKDGEERVPRCEEVEPAEAAVCGAGPQPHAMSQEHPLQTQTVPLFESFI